MKLRKLSIRILRGWHFFRICMPFIIFSLRISAQTNTAFFNAIRSGSVTELEKEMAKGANVNDTLDGGYSALMVAVLSGSVDQMKLLVDHGAKINYANADSITALWLAVPDWDKSVFLLDHGADANMLSTEHYTALVKVATYPGTSKLFQQFIDHGAEPKKAARDNSLVYNAAATGDTALLGMLLRMGFNPGDSVFTRDYPIDNSMSYRCFATMKMLVDHGANVNASSTFSEKSAGNGFTPLMWAALGNDRQSLFYLLDHGADVNRKNKKGHTALMLLQQSNIDDPEMTMALIKHGASVSAKMPDGTDALYFASRKGNSKSAQILKQYLNQ